MAKRWYKRCGSDFITGTMGLSLEEKGAYSLCLDLIYDHESPIPDDARWLSGVCGVSIRKWATIREKLISVGKLYSENGFLMNARASIEIESQEKYHQERSESGAKGGRKRIENLSKPHCNLTKPQDNVDENDVRFNKNNNLDEAQLNQEDKIREEKIKEINKEKPPSGERERNSSENKKRKFDWPENYREVIWDIFPRTTEKKDGMIALADLYRRDNLDFQQFLDAIRRQAASTDKKYCKALHRWIKKECWNDEFITEKRQSSPMGQMPDDAWKGAVLRWKNSPSSWPNGLGARPDAPGCRVPTQILIELGIGEAA